MKAEACCRGMEEIDRSASSVSYSRREEMVRKVYGCLSWTRKLLEVVYGSVLLDLIALYKKMALVL